MIYCKKTVFCIVLVFLVGLVSLITFNNDNFTYTSGGISNLKTVIIDAGHGGFDGGAVAADGTVEKDINLKISSYIADMLKTAGYKVILTREADVSTDDVETDTIAVRKKSDLKNRLKLMKDYPDAIFVSIHLNKFTTSAARGSQVFYNGKILQSKQLGECIQNSIISLLQPENTRVNKQATSSTYLLYNATLPAVLIECGFLSNKAELEFLKNENYQKKMALCCFLGITEYFSDKGDIKDVAKS